MHLPYAILYFRRIQQRSFAQNFSSKFQFQTLNIFYFLNDYYIVDEQQKLHTQKTNLSTPFEWLPDCFRTFAFCYIKTRQENPFITTNFGAGTTLL